MWSYLGIGILIFVAGGMLFIASTHLFMKAADWLEDRRSAKEDRKFQERLCRNMRLGRTKDVSEKWWQF